MPADSSREYAAISAGTAGPGGTATRSPGTGSSSGSWRGYDLPTTLPQHPECDDAQQTLRGVGDEQAMMVTVSTGWTGATTG